MKKSIYVISEIYASIEDTVALDTFVATTMEAAKEKADELEKEWLQNMTDINYEVYDMTDEENQQWIANSLCTDSVHPTGMYKSYIYSDGDEKVFSIEQHEIDIEI